VAAHPRSHTGRFLATHLADPASLSAPQKGKP